MAAEKYSTPFVLEGNWLETRAVSSGGAPAEKDVPDRWVTTASATYGAIPRVARAAPTRAGIMGADSWNEVAYCTGGAVDTRGFDMTHGGRPMNKGEIAATFRSTARDAMASGVSVSAGAMADAAKSLKMLAGTKAAVAAGGAGSVTLDRGKRIVGASGEKVMGGDDGRLHTGAQRSWLCRPDAGLVAFAKPPAPRQEVDWMSPNIGDGEAKHVVPLGAAHGQFAAYAAPARQQTDVTASLGGSRRKGVRVFADDP